MPEKIMKETLTNRVSDYITRFSGSMLFVYIHSGIFAYWILTDGWPFNDPFPYGLLTMVVSLEAIYLSTFVLISQNRADETRAGMAQAQYLLVRAAERQNERIIALENEHKEMLIKLDRMMSEIHKHLLESS